MFRKGQRGPAAAPNTPQRGRQRGIWGWSWLKRGRPRPNMPDVRPNSTNSGANSTGTVRSWPAPFRPQFGRILLSGFDRTWARLRRGSATSGQFCAEIVRSATEVIQFRPSVALKCQIWDEAGQICGRARPYFRQLRPTSPEFGPDSTGRSRPIVDRCWPIPGAWAWPCSPLLHPLSSRVLRAPALLGARVSCCSCRVGGVCAGRVLPARTL